MSDLFLRTENGNMPLIPDLVQKYHLKKGEKSPFSSQVIVDRFGDARTEPPKAEPVSDDDSQLLSTAEIIDFMQGADSSDA